MKKTIVFLAAIFVYSAAFCQYDTTPPYLKSKLLPELNGLLTLDSAAVSQKILKPGLHTIIMMYNPECGHCQKQMELFLSMPEVMSQAQIVLATTLPIYRIKEFCDKYKLGQYPNIHPCKDNSWYLGKFYQPRAIPLLAFYNKENKFTFISQGNASKEQVLEALKQ